MFSPVSPFFRQRGEGGQNPSDKRQVILPSARPVPSLWDCADPLICSTRVPLEPKLISLLFFAYYCQKRVRGSCDSQQQRETVEADESTSLSLSLQRESKKRRDSPKQINTAPCNHLMTLSWPDQGPSRRDVKAARGVSYIRLGLSIY